MKAFIWFAFVLLSAAWTGLAALTVKASDWLLGTVASVHGGEALGNAVKQPLPEALAPWINPVWLAAPREFLLGALQMADLTKASSGCCCPGGCCPGGCCSFATAFSE